MPGEMESMTRQELEQRAKKMGIGGTSKMNKQQLMDAMSKGKM